MKLRLKIIKENKDLLKEGRYDGLYQAMGVYPGSLDIFLKHFAEDDITVSRELFEFTREAFKDEIESLEDADIPRTSARGRKTPLDKVKVGLYWGQTHWWNQVFGEEMAASIVEFKVLSYLGELKDKFDAINYTTITAEEFEALPREQKNVVYEKHFLEDHFSDFFDAHVATTAMNTTGYVGNIGHGSGLYGQLSDWWMGGDGAPIFKAKMLENISLLPQAGS